MYSSGDRRLLWTVKNRIGPPPRTVCDPAGVRPLSSARFRRFDQEPVKPDHVETFVACDVPEASGVAFSDLAKRLISVQMFPALLVSPCSGGRYCDKLCLSHSVTAYNCSKSHQRQTHKHFSPHLVIVTSFSHTCAGAHNQLSISLV